MDMLKAVDTMVQVKTPTGCHIGPNLKLDFESILKGLVQEEVFQTKKGHKHK